MVCQKIANLLGNMLDQPSKFRAKNWVEINDESKESYNTTLLYKLLHFADNFQKTNNFA